jgi:aspartyl-tRNA(Asn)/glutamyl-tRNA(Gln) amidotransferase subunit A
MSDLSPLAALRVALAKTEIQPETVAAEAQSKAENSPTRNTYLHRDPARASREAASLPERFPDASARPSLYGVPVSVKDCFDMSGTVTSCGSRFYARMHRPAAQDSWIVERLRDAGAVTTGKTHLHQLAYGITGENADYGDCVQPRDGSLLTGGSSSGAVASVQEGSALFAIGTDTGGSIRVPAALCGLAGYRASHGLLPEPVCWRGGAHLAVSFDTLGFVFRDLRDGPALAQAVFDLPIVAAPNEARIGIVGEQFLHDCDADVLEAYAAWKDRLSRHDATLEGFDTAFWQECIEVFTTIQASEAAALHRGQFAHFEKAIGERLAWGASITEDALLALRARLAAFRDRMAALFERFDFLLLPCAPVSRLPAHQDQSGARARILRYTSPISMAGLPTVTLPGELLGGHFGTGMQLAAPRLHDARLLAYAAALATAS